MSPYETQKTTHYPRQGRSVSWELLRRDPRAYEFYARSPAPDETEKKEIENEF
jgi:hypothetical protein